MMHISQALHRLTPILIGAGPSVFGMYLLGITAFGIAFILGVWLVISIIRSGML